MKITYTNSISVDDYNMLRKSVGWYEIEKTQALKGLQNTKHFIVAKCENKIVGFARAITDNGYVAFIVDVIVLPEYQSHGIGKTMITNIIDNLMKDISTGQNLYIMLLSSKGKEEFYKKFGFEERPNDTLGAGMSLWITKTN